MAKGPYRDHREEISKSFHEADKKVSQSFAFAFGFKRKHNILLLAGYKIIKTREKEKGEELVYVCAKTSGEIEYDDNSAFSLAKSYAKVRKEENCEFRPVVLIKKGDNFFEVISRPVEVLFPHDIEKIEWEKRLSVLTDVNKDEMMKKVVPGKRNRFQRFVCRIFRIK